MFGNDFRTLRRTATIKEFLSGAPWHDGDTEGERDIQMTLPVATLDHVVINARDDMDRAADIYRRVGFTLNGRGYHSLGSRDPPPMFGPEFLQLLAVPEDAPDGRLALPHLPVRPDGRVFGRADPGQ